MCKKLMFLISLVLVLGLGTVASADDYDYTGDYPWSQLYISPWNWDPASPYGGPGPGDTAYVGGPELIVLDTDIEVENIRGPAWQADYDDPGSDQLMLLVKDCNALVTGRWSMEKTGDWTGYIEGYDVAKVFVDGRFVAHGDDQRAVISLFDESEFYVKDDVRCGDDDDDYFELNVTDDAFFHAGDDDDGFRHNEGTVLLNVDSNGIVECEYLRFRSKSEDRTATINVSENGQIIVTDSGFRCAGGSSLFTVNVSDNGVIDADNYVRFGEDNDYDNAAFLNMLSGDPLVTMGGDFQIVDDDDSSGFTTVNLLAGLIDTSDGDLEYETLNWVINQCGDGVWVLDGDVVDEVIEHVEAGRWIPCPQEDCWGGISPRGNIRADYNTPEYPGDTKVWVEEMDGQAWAPLPAPGAECQPPIVELCWCPGESDCPEPLEFHVFLSDDRQEVEDGNLHAWQGVQTENCFTTEPLCLGKTYYWRVESVFDCCYYPGPVWSFTICESECIEDMEAYDDVSNPIWETWLDGCGDANGLGGNGTGSCVYTDTAIVHGGDKAMRYYYDCSGEDMAGDERDCNYAIATRDLVADLSSNCAQTIELWFYGDPGNDATALEAMFMQIEDGSSNSAVATYGDTAPEALADMQVAEWQQWDIALASFGGVDTTDVVKMSLGFGDVTNCHDQKGGYGVVRIDDICLFNCRCVPKYTPDVVDLNDDCVTDWLDIKMVADTWLEDRRCTQ
jgi:hypothetical protein